MLQSTPPQDRPEPAVLDPKHSGFAAECLRQSLIVAEADGQDPDLDAFLDAALLDLETMDA
jgi:hypothetical protein